MRITKLAFVGVLLAFLGAFGVVSLFAIDLPSPDKIVRREGFSTKILDRNGKVLYDIYTNERRNPVELSQVPNYLRQATIAIEDKNFYKHQGFDPTGIVRAFGNIILKGKVQGGSTLTQQLVKTVLLSSERTIFRKLREFILAVQIERKYSKDQILQMYLNEVPYGGTAVGVESASEVYFGKKVSDLTLVESAILAGLPQRPSAYSPYSSTPKAYVARTQQVLRRMREDGYITKEQEEGAKTQIDGIEFQAKGAGFKAPHFVQYVEKVLADRYGEGVIETGGLKVTTTLDLDLQEKAQEIVGEEIAKVEKQKITNGAAVVIDPATGEILVMVGSKNFNDPNYDGQYNVTTALRQPGSAIKPFTYVTAFKKGYTASTLLMDTPTIFPGGVNQPDYEPENYDGKFRGPIQVRYALGNSINIAAVKMLAKVGIKDLLQTTYDMGITTLEPTQDTMSKVGLSLTLGGGEVRLLELTSAYSPFMNGGDRVEPTSILKVEDHNGKVLEEVKPKPVRRVLTKEQAFLITSILSDNNARLEVFGPNSALVIPGRTVAVKTGTTNDRRDNWTVGGNIEGIVGVWVGNNDYSPMGSLVSGVSGAAPIWRKIILEVLRDKPNVTFQPPEGIVSANVDSISGYREHDGFGSRTEFFIKGTEPSGDDPVHLKMKVCKTDGKIASPTDIASGNYEEKEYFIFKEEDPTQGTSGQNRWQEGILKWLSTQGDSKYHPPSDYCGGSNPIHVEFSEPGDRQTLGNNFNIKVRADSTADITQIELEIDGVKVRTFDSPPYEHNVTLSDGPHTIRAKAKDVNGKESDRVITIGVNVPWDWAASPAPSPTPGI